MNCVKCGKELVPGAKFCQGCGTRVEEQISLEKTSSPQPPVQPHTPASSSSQNFGQTVSSTVYGNGQGTQSPFGNNQMTERFSKGDYAGFWLRVAASILDSLIIGLPVGIILVIVMIPMMLQDSNFYDGGFTGILYLVSIVGTWLYYALMESSSWQGTLGKKIVGIKVTDLDGNRISFGRATGRYFGKMLSGIFYIGFIMVAATEKKQGLHDMLASCLVVKK